MKLEKLQNFLRDTFQVYLKMVHHEILRKTTNTYKHNRGHSGLYIAQCKLSSKENSHPIELPPKSDMNGLNPFDTNTAENAVNVGVFLS
jgi:hypothetical protein